MDRAINVSIIPWPWQKIYKLTLKNVVKTQESLNANKINAKKVLRPPLRTAVPISLKIITKHSYQMGPKVNDLKKICMYNFKIKGY